MDAARDPAPVGKGRRRWSQFRLRTVLLAMTILAISLGYEAERARRQKRAVAAVRRLGGTVIYDYQQLSVIPFIGVSPGGGTIVVSGSLRHTEPRTPNWIRDWIGEDFFATVEGVDLSNMPATDADLLEVREFSHLRLLDLSRTRITDSGLDCLKSLPRLESLRLSGTAVTDAGMEHLQGLRNLRLLSLACEGVSDAGLKHLAGLGELQKLDLGGGLVNWRDGGHMLQPARLTDEGLRHLQRLGRLEILDLRGTKIGNAGLEHLKPLVRLKILELSDTMTTEKGRDELKKALPNLYR